MRAGEGQASIARAIQHPWALLNHTTLQNHAQAELGDVVYVELPEVGSTVTKGETYGVVESVKVRVCCARSPPPPPPRRCSGRAAQRRRRAG